MKKQPFERFIDLVTFDQKIKSIEHDIEHINRSIESIDNDIQIQKLRFDQVQDDAYEARKTVDYHELVMREFSEKITQARWRLDHVENQREYAIAKKEIELLKSQEHEYEETLLQVWQQLEHTQVIYDQQKKIIEELVNTAQQKKDELEQQKNLLITQANIYRAERTGQEVDLPEEWIEKYMLMRLRVPNPVVPVAGDSCSGCFLTLTEGDLQRINRNAIIPCGECFRLLYRGQPIKSDTKNNVEIGKA